MPVKGTIVEPPDDMNKEAVRKKAEGLLAALKAMNARPPEQTSPQQSQEQDAAKPQGADAASVDDDKPDASEGDSGGGEAEDV